MGLAPEGEHNRPGSEPVQLWLGRAPCHCRGCDGVGAVAAGGGERLGQERRQEGGSCRSPEGGCRLVDLGSRQAGTAWRAGCTWEVGWRRRGCWEGGRSGRTKSCSWAALGKEEAGDTEQKNWAVEGGRRGTAKGQETYPAPTPRGARECVRPRLAPLCLGSWRWPPCCSGGAGLAVEASWLGHGEMRQLKPEVRMVGGWLGASSEGAGHLAQGPTK